MAEILNAGTMPIVSKFYCASSQVLFLVRERPLVKIVFRVDGCGVVGKQGTGRNCSGPKHKKWKGYSFDCEGLQKLVFSLMKQKSFLIRINEIRVSAEPRRNRRDWDFKIKGYFPDRDCSIVDYSGNIEVKEVMTSKDLYQVLVKPGIDQAFVFGVIAILDYIYGESTRC
ncbi:hypothetical protein P3X46_007548 [Hevea brasiliensis]|uniref:Tubby C-terminal domain-containing protein n=1 Tax=Hevea brasiliensis TaxID=3981 RepID=A0ABQ9MU00_HEVBR|nr:hypothetical protein P3X46_007548 [Hevea brasiliensis]